jgi:heme oxygenase
MDPLSLTASLISIGGLLTAVAKSVHKVQNLIHAAREINVLSNEISDLQAVLQNVEHAVQDRQHTSVLQQQTFPNLSPNIQAAKDKLLELDTILRHRLIKTASADGVTKVNRIQWLKERTNVMRLQSELRNIRHNLMTQISALYS